MKKHHLAAIAFLLVSGFTLPAFAAPAAASVSLNVRLGPGTTYAVIDTLFPGERVDVRSQTSNGWCAIRHNGPNGYVSCRYLTAVGPGGGFPDDDDDDPDINFSINTPNFSFSIGNNPPRPGFPGFPGFPGRRDFVCFYEHAGYDGRSFCARPGQADRRLGGFWNDRISSIRVFGDASVRVCEDANFRDCRTFSRNVSYLGGMNDEISSYIVRD